MGSELILICYECYVNIGLKKLSLHILLSDISKEIVRPLGYFLYELCIGNLPISENCNVLRHPAYDMVFRMNVLNILNFMIHENKNLNLGGGGNVENAN